MCMTTDSECHRRRSEAMERGRFFLACQHLTCCLLNKEPNDHNEVNYDLQDELAALLSEPWKRIDRQNDKAYFK